MVFPQIREQECVQLEVCVCATFLCWFDCLYIPIEFTEQGSFLCCSQHFSQM